MRFEITFFFKSSASYFYKISSEIRVRSERIFNSRVMCLLFLQTRMNFLLKEFFFYFWVASHTFKKSIYFSMVIFFPLHVFFFVSKISKRAYFSGNVFVHNGNEGSGTALFFLVFLLLQPPFSFLPVLQPDTRVRL